MKKTFFLLAAMTMFVSCSQTETIDEIGNDSSHELSLNTMANQTRAVAEGTTVPTDNVIGFYPNFHSDLSSTDFTPYNNIGLFGYDSQQNVWRNVDMSNPLNNDTPSERDKRAHPGAIPTIPFNYNYSPVYWPAGDRVFMDYVACSYSFMLPMMNAILGNSGKGSPLTVAPVSDNANRMSVNYKYNMPENNFYTVERPSENHLSQLCQYIPLVNEFGIQTGIDDDYLKKFEDNYLDKYSTALGKLYTEGKTYVEAVEELTNDEIEALNLGYELYVKCYPVINKFMQDDLLYAHDRNLKNDNHGSVKATFNHAKAWVKVIVNNQTQNDIYVNDIRFNNVKSSGTLVIDNSKSAFETYWDFPQTPAATGASIAPYSPVNLNGSIPADPIKTDEPTTPTEDPELPGMVPDVYLVPSHCYGPALSVCQGAIDMDGKVDNLVFKYLDGSKPFSISNSDCINMVGKLSGMMFPAQEPGMITISYNSWEHNSGNYDEPSEFTSNGDYILHNFNVVKLWKYNGNPDKKITLNLPRQTWQMGKVYVYVLTIGEDEITINPIVTEWQDAAPIVYPDQENPEQPSGYNGNIDKFGGNDNDPDWDLKQETPTEN